MIETIYLLEALKTRFMTGGLLPLIPAGESGMVEGSYAGRLQMPYLKIADLGGSDQFKTNKGRYTEVNFDLIVVDSDKRRGALVLKKAMELTENAPLTLPTGYRVTEIRRGGFSAIESEDTWELHQAFSGKIASSPNPRPS